MKLCRFDDDRLGLVADGRVLDVSGALELLPRVRWPLPVGDPLIAGLARLRPEVEKRARGAESRPLDQVRLLSPVANPSKIIGAPSNFLKEVGPEINFGRKSRPIREAGLFLKANSSLVGPSEGCALRFPDRRNDHELELAVVIGTRCNQVAEADALSCVAGYAIGLDMTVRGPEDRSFRKSIDTYSVLGPWLVTADEVADPDALDMSLSVGGEARQVANTRDMVLSVAEQIAWASSYYTLHPGDIIMAGTPPGMGPVKPGDVMHCEIESIGAMDVPVRAA